MKEAKESTERIKREARLERKIKVEEKARLEMMGRKVSHTSSYWLECSSSQLSYTDERKEAGSEEETNGVDQEGLALILIFFDLQLYYIEKQYPWK